MKGASPFETARDALRREVRHGRYRGQYMLPGERDLSETLSVSRTTLRRVLAALAAEGLLSQRHGVGTFIEREAPPEASAGGAALTGFGEDTRARGMVPSSREIERGVYRPTPEEAMMLACPPEAPVIRLSRIRYADDQAVAVDRAVVPAALLGGADAIGPSLYASLEARGAAPMRALQRVQATLLGHEDARRLGVAPGSAGLLVLRTAYLGDGRCCEFTRSLCGPDHTVPLAELRRRDAPR